MNLNELIREHEGYSRFPYKCTAGKLTIGYGLNLDAGVDRDLAALILDYQIINVKQACNLKLDWFQDMDQVRRDVVVNMVFNLGMQRFLKFKKTIGYLNESRYTLASFEMLDSKWATQVGARAYELSEMMRTGEDV